MDKLSGKLLLFGVFWEMSGSLWRVRGVPEILPRSGGALELGPGGVPP
ncbi:hypothetical protein HMPREF9057_02170 [Actinomyces sp. oral taxon 171 str. F0337]|nr:hypothetical protein HMPREF9057_02170 [Actinomyces sp. oral taxon 171 str. F0337]